MTSRPESEPVSRPVLFVGAGPGDPELITLRGARALAEADVVVWAGSLVHPDVLSHCRPDAEIHDSAALDLQRIVGIMTEAWRAGRSVVRLHTGDPSLYGAIAEQIDELDALGVPHEVIPGVSSFAASAAVLQAELTRPGISQTVILTRRAGRTPVPEGQDLPSLAAHQATMCIFLSVGSIDGVVADLLTGYPPETPVAVVANATWPEQKIVRGTLEDVAERIAAAGVEKTAMIVVGGILGEGGEASKLYDPTFSHGYRAAASRPTQAPPVAVSADVAPDAAQAPPRPSEAVAPVSARPVMTGGVVACAPAEHSVAVYALTAGGAAIARRIAEALNGELRLPARLAGGGGFGAVGDALREDLVAGRALVCVMAAGVVVRSVAPALRGKLEDPPVLVVDEAGRHVVPVLSGHLGGGNALARRVARALGATPVLTTSTDVQGLLGPDLLASMLDAHVQPRGGLLPVAAALADGREVDVWFDPDELGPVGDFLSSLNGYRARHLGGPDPLAPMPPAPVAVVVSLRSDAEIPPESRPERVLHLTPRWIVAGAGCTRGTPKEALIEAIRDAFAGAGLREEALRAVASAAAKEEEPGLLEAASALRVPVVFAHNEALSLVMDERGLAESEWVRESIGVGGVCEPAALWAAGPEAVLVRGKAAGGGVTVALARVDGAALVAERQEEWTS
jgi:precorrin-4 C11-methyltransferase